jgi:hypothetical protein
MNSTETLFNWLKRILIVHLLAVVAQAVTSGTFMSGNHAAVGAHVLVSRILLGICLLQIAVTIILRRRGGCPNWALISAFAILVFEGLEIYFGVRRELILHVPLALGIYGGIMRQAFWAIREVRTGREASL